MRFGEHCAAPFEETGLLIPSGTDTDAHDFKLRRNPPQIGEDTADLLSELGYQADEIEKLAEEGVVAKIRDR